jgi:hypothetical protein
MMLGDAAVWCNGTCPSPQQRLRAGRLPGAKPHTVRCRAPVVYTRSGAVDAAYWTRRYGGLGDLEGGREGPWIARVGLELYRISMEQQTCDTKGTGTQMPGEIGQTPSGRRRSRPATASRIGDRSPPRASGIHSGIPRMASSCGNRCTQPFASLDSSLGSWKNHSARKTHNCARTCALDAQSIGKRLYASVTALTCQSDRGYVGLKVGATSLPPMQEPAYPAYRQAGGRQAWGLGESSRGRVFNGFPAPK